MNLNTIFLSTQSLQEGAEEVVKKVSKLSEYLGKAQDVLEEYSRQSQVISSAFEENIGFGRGVIDPTTLGDSSWSLFESQDTFLQRTLMTGSDIAELSNSMISNFTELTINQDLLI